MRCCSRQATATLRSTTAPCGQPTTLARRPSTCQGSRSIACVTRAPPWRRSSERPWLSSKPESGTARPTWRCATNTSPPNATLNWPPACQHSPPVNPPLVSGSDVRTRWPPSHGDLGRAAEFSLEKVLLDSRVLVDVVGGDDHVAEVRSGLRPVSYTHLRAHETVLDLVCRL